MDRFFSVRVVNGAKWDRTPVMSACPTGHCP